MTAVNLSPAEERQQHVQAARWPHILQSAHADTEGSHLKPCTSLAAQQLDWTSQLRSLGTLTKDTCIAQALTQQLHGDKCVNAFGTPDQAKLEDPAQ